MDTFDLVVIGAGPGGYVAAIRAAQLRLRVALVEKDTSLGGTCLNVGCIPSKVLLESSELFHVVSSRLPEHGIRLPQPPVLDLAAMMARKQRIVRELTDGVAQLMKKNKVTVVRGRGALDARGDRVLVSAPTGEVTHLGARNILLATGSAPIALPFLPFDGERVVDSTGALALDRVPEHLVVVGAGAVGLELGSVWRRLGARVTVVEMLPQIVPFADGQLSRTLQRALKAQGLDLRLKTTVTGATIDDAGVTLTLGAQGSAQRSAGGSATGSAGGSAAGSAGGSAGGSAQGSAQGSEQLRCDRVLVAVGRRAYVEGLGLDEVGLALERGKLPVDERLRTRAAGPAAIYALGDLVAGPMLAHKAEEEGSAVAETVAGRAGHVSYETIPNVVYTSPELAAVGLTEEQVKERGLEPRIGRFLFRANGRAKSLGEEEGLVKILADAKTDRLLGVHIVGPRASEMIAEAVIALEFRASAEDLARTVHAHPTLAEVTKEAALDVDKRAIHA